MSGHIPNLGRDARRIGDRASIEPTPASITVVAGRMIRKPRSVDVEIVNASVTGVGFTAVLPGPLPVGAVTEMRLDGAVTRIRIRQAMPTLAAPRTYFGAEFIDPHPAILGPLQRLIHGGLPAEKDLRWDDGSVR